MKASELFRVTAMSALTEMQKMGQKFPITGETFDPFKGDASGFTLKNQKVTKPAEQSRKTYHVQNTPASFTREPDAVSESPTSIPLAQLDTPQQPAKPREQARLVDDLSVCGMRRALILSEILAPPLALRGRR